MTAVNWPWARLSRLKMGRTVSGSNWTISGPGPGLFHAFGWFAVVAALFMVADLRRHAGLWWSRWAGGVLIGAGGFQLYDGLVQHKVLGLHQIRYGVNLILYDVTWNIVAAILIAVGVVLTVRTRAASAAPA